MVRLMMYSVIVMVKLCSKKDNKIEYFYQDGGLPGFKSIYIIYPDRDITVILLSNYDFINMQDILDKIEESVLISTTI